MTAIDIAKRIVATNPREIGRNTDNGGIIDRVQRELGLSPGNPWCAAFVSHCFREAGAGSAFPYSASSQYIKKWFEDRGLLSRDPQDLLKWTGAIAGWTNQPDTSHGHIFLVAGRGTTTLGGVQRVINIKSFEGNTNSQGGRDGDGAYARIRQVPVDNDHRLWFCNTGSIPGGQWW